MASGNLQVQATVSRRLDHSVGKAASLIDHHVGAVKPVKFLNRRDRPGHRDAAGPVTSGEEHVGYRVAKRVGTHKGRNRLAVGNGLAVTRQVGLEAEIVGRSAKRAAESGTNVINRKNDAVFTADLTPSTSLRPEGRYR